MRLTDRMTRFASTLRERPKVAAATAATAVAAIVAGVALSLLIGGRGEAAVGPTASPTPLPASTSETASPMPSMPVFAPTPTPVPTPTPTVAATVPPTPDPTPTPTAAEGGYGGTIPGPGAAFEDPNWETMPAMPEGAHPVEGVVLLEDGRLLAMQPPHDDSGWTVMSIRAGDETWSPIPISGLDSGRDFYSFTLGPDGRIYTDALVIDPAARTWTAADAGWEHEFASHVVGFGPDGRLYGQSPTGTSLVALDPETGEVIESSENDSRGASALLFQALVADDTELFAVDIATVMAYDPARETWRVVHDWGWSFAAQAGLGPDGHLYMMADEEEGRGIRRIDTAAATWSEIPRPYEAEWEWTPRFVTGPDGRLWAVGATQVFALRPQSWD